MLGAWVLAARSAAGAVHPPSPLPGQRGRSPTPRWPASRACGAPPASRDFRRQRTADREGRGDRLTELGGDLRQQLGGEDARANVVVWLLVLVVLLVGSRELILSGVPQAGELLAWPAGPVVLVREYLGGWWSQGLGGTRPVPTGMGLSAVLGLAHLRRQRPAPHAARRGPALRRRARAVALRPRHRAEPRLRRPPWPSTSRCRWPPTPSAPGSLSGLLVYGALPWTLHALARLHAAAPVRAPQPTRDRARRLRWRRRGRARRGRRHRRRVRPRVPARDGGRRRWPSPPDRWSWGSGRAAGGWCSAASVAGIDRRSSSTCPGCSACCPPPRPAGPVLGVPPARGRPSRSRARWPRSTSGPNRLRRAGPRPHRCRSSPRCWRARSYRFAWAGRAALLGRGRPGHGVAGRPGHPAGQPEPDPGVPRAVRCRPGDRARPASWPASPTTSGGRRSAGASSVGVVALVAALVGLVPLVPAIVSGRWELDDDERSALLGLLPAPPEGAESRVLWVGAPEDVPVPGWPLADGLIYALADEDAATLRERWREEPTRAEQTGGGRHRSGGQRRRPTGWVGSLAPMGVRFVLVPVSAASGDAAMAPLRPVTVRATSGPPSSTRSTASSTCAGSSWATTPSWPTRTRPGCLCGPTAAGAVAAGQPAGRGRGARSAPTTAAPCRALPGPLPTAGAGPVQGESVLLSEAVDERWELTVDGRSMPRRTAFGWATAWDLDAAGEGSFRYRTAVSRYAVVAGPGALGGAGAGADPDLAPRSALRSVDGPPPSRRQPGCDRVIDLTAGPPDPAARSRAAGPHAVIARRLPFVVVGAALVGLLVVDRAGDRAGAAPSTYGRATAGRRAPRRSSTATLLSTSWFCPGGPTVGDRSTSVTMFNSTDDPREVTVSAVSEAGMRGSAPLSLPAPQPGGGEPRRIWPRASTRRPRSPRTGAGSPWSRPWSADRASPPARAPIARRARGTWPTAPRRPTPRFILVLYNPFPDDAVVDVVADHHRADTGATQPAGPSSFPGSRCASSTSRRRRSGRRWYRRRCRDGAPASSPGASSPADNPNRRGFAAGLAAAQPQQTWWFPDGGKGEGVSRALRGVQPRRARRLRRSCRSCPADGVAPPAPVSIVVPPSSFQLVDVDALAEVPPGDHSTVVNVVGDQTPVVVERLLTRPLDDTPVTTMLLGSQITVPQWYVIEEAAARGGVVVVMNSAGLPTTAAVKAIGPAGAVPVPGLEAVPSRPAARRPSPSPRPSAGSRCSSRAAQPVVVEWRARADAGDRVSRVDALGVPRHRRLTVGAGAPRPRCWRAWRPWSAAVLRRRQRTAATHTTHVPALRPSSTGPTSPGPKRRSWSSSSRRPPATRVPPWPTRPRVLASDQVAVDVMEVTEQPRGPPQVRHRRRPNGGRRRCARAWSEPASSGPASATDLGRRSPSCAIRARRPNRDWALARPSRDDSPEPRRRNQRNRVAPPDDDERGRLCRSVRSDRGSDHIERPM